MIGTNVTNIETNAANIVTEQTARMEADTMLGGRIDNEATARMAMDDELMGHITTNAGNIMANEMSIGANAIGHLLERRWHCGQHERDRCQRSEHRGQPQHDR